MDLNLEELDMEETVGKDTALYIDGVRPQQPQAVPSVSMLPPSYTPFCGPRSYASVASNKNKGKGKGKGHNCFQKFRLSLHTTHRWCTRLRFQGGEGGGCVVGLASTTCGLTLSLYGAKHGRLSNKYDIHCRLF